jgi:uncharacterized membrane protein YgcG
VLSTAATTGGALSPTSQDVEKSPLLASSPADSSDENHTSAVNGYPAHQNDEFDDDHVVALVCVVLFDVVLSSYSFVVVVVLVVVSPKTPNYLLYLSFTTRSRRTLTPYLTYLDSLQDNIQSGLDSFPEYWSDEAEDRAMEFVSDDSALSDDPDADVAHEQIVQRFTVTSAAPSADSTVADLQAIRTETPPSSPPARARSPHDAPTSGATGITAAAASDADVSADANAKHAHTVTGIVDEEVHVPSFEVVSSEDLLYQSGGGVGGGGGGSDGGGGRRNTIPFEVSLDESALEERSADARTCAEKARVVGRKLCKRLPQYIPSLYWIPRYPWREYLAADLIAGLAVGIMVIPQGLAYAGLAGLDPIYGLYTAFVPVIMYAFLGTARQLSMGPDGIVALLVGSAIQPDSTTSSEVRCCWLEEEEVVVVPLVSRPSA